MLKDLVIKNRSYRRFYQEEKVSEETLRELVGLARFSATGANKQPLKFILSCDEYKNSIVFECLKWAGYLTDWVGPEERERPSGYIVILEDLDIRQVAGVDHGIAAQSILLGAVEKGLGGCMFGAIDKPKLKENLKIADNFEILLVVAIGKPKEEVVIDPVVDGEIKYWRDQDQVHHVPKRSLDDIIID
ncbi:MAG: nitroreductase family protein [Candidatus Delongbacteria bacterium]|jgi:nitroreductase|nr:nitroreductase family protein [Candidatus Delongbacteria bacterium]